MHRHLVVLASVLLVAGSACSQAAATDPLSPPPAPAPPGTRAPDIDRVLDLTAGASSGRFTFTTVVEGGDGDDIEVNETRTEGAFDERSGRFSRRLFVPDDAGMAEAMHVVVDGATFYVDSAVPDLPTGWFTSTHPGGAAALLDDARAVGFLDDPSGYAEVLRDVEPLDPDGADDLDGDPMERFRSTVPLGRLLDSMQSGDDGAVSASGPSDLERMAEEVSDLDDAVPVVVWLHPDGRLRRYELEYRVDGGAQGRIVVRISLDLYDYGEDITIEVPDPAEVQPMP